LTARLPSEQLAPARSMRPSTYVLVTPARNEAATIAETIESVIRQTLRPVEWVVVSDGSTDRTDDIVREYAAAHPYIRLLRLDARHRHNFASVVFALDAGVADLKTPEYDFLGLLDADVRFRPDYFEALIARFAAAPHLGLAGGLVLDVGSRGHQHQYIRDVAGATQFFRRECFQSLGGLIPIREGGWDAITNFHARANGYETATFPDLVVDHLKPRNIAAGGGLRGKWQFGLRDYALGYDPVFEAAKCAGRWNERPLIVGSMARLAGFAWATVSRRERVLSPALIRAIRREQRRRLFRADRSTVRRQ
jgi:biofilm PGA synthesis N-glycosyltransferase PgaC